MTMQKLFVLAAGVVAFSFAPAFGQGCEDILRGSDPTRHADRAEDVVLIGGTVIADSVSRYGYSQVGNIATTVIYTRSNEKINQRDRKSDDYRTCKDAEIRRAEVEARRAEIDAQERMENGRNLSQERTELERQKTERERIAAEREQAKLQAATQAITSNTPAGVVEVNGVFIRKTLR